MIGRFLTFTAAVLCGCSQQNDALVRDATTGAVHPQQREEAPKFVTIRVVDEGSCVCKHKQHRPPPIDGQINDPKKDDHVIDDWD